MFVLYIYAKSNSNSYSIFVKVIMSESNALIFVLFLLEIIGSKYEAYVTNTKTYKWNKILPLIALVFLVVTSSFMLLTDLIIKIFFKIKHIPKPKIENTIKFKTLNLAYGFGLLCAALLHIAVLQLKSKDTYFIHYTISIIFNPMLGSFIYFNDDILKYLKMKMFSLKQRLTFNNNNNNNMRRLETSRGVGEWMNCEGRNKNRTYSDKNQQNKTRRDPIFVIDIEQ